jgi:hypothetical protein
VPQLDDWLKTFFSACFHSQSYNLKAAIGDRLEWASFSLSIQSLLRNCRSLKQHFKLQVHADGLQSGA